MDNTVTDLRSFPFASLTFSEAEGDFCRKHVYDPEDPRCARLTLTGKMVEVGPEELDFAKEAMFSRHPVMKKWPPEHDWFFMKLVLQQVWLQHWVGGVSVVPLEEYFKATPFWEKVQQSIMKTEREELNWLYRRWLCFCFFVSSSEHVPADLLNVSIMFKDA